MSATGIPIDLNALTDANGDPLSGFKAYSWVPDSDGAPTATPRALYTDAACTTPASNPVVGDSAGYKVVYKKASEGVVVVVKDTSAATTYLTKHYPSVLVTSDALDDLGAVRSVGTYAEMTSLTADEMTANALVYTRSRASLNDGGHGLWRMISGSAYTTNGGTLLSHDSLSWQFQRVDPAWVSLEMFGGGVVTSGIASNTTAFNNYISAVEAGFAPRELRLIKSGTYHFETLPDVMEDLGSINISAPGISAVVTRGWTSADETDAVFHAYGATQLVATGFAMGTAADGSEGGSLIRLEAKASSAPDFSDISNIYFTTYGGASAKTITGLTIANPAVFTVTGHGYSDGDVVVITLQGSTLYPACYQEFVISDKTTDTFKLKYPGTSTYYDSSGGTFTTGIVCRRLAPSAMISIDGSARTTGAIGVRGVKVSHSQIFGAGKGGIYCKGAVDVSLPGTTTSGAGLNAALVFTGDGTVPTYYAKADGGTVDGVREDYSYYSIISCVNQGHHIRTSNTLWSTPTGVIAGYRSTGGNYSSNESFMLLPGGMVLQRLSVSGLSGVAATKSWTFAYKTAPGIYWASDQVTTLSSPTTTGIDATNASSASAIIFSIGQI